MKRLISTLLMLSMMAALLCVPAFADVVVDSLTVSSSTSAITTNTVDNITCTVRLGPSNASNLGAGHPILWTLNGTSTYQNTTDASGVATAAYRPEELIVGTNTIKAEVVGYSYLNATCTVTKSEEYTSMGTYDMLTLNKTSFSINLGAPAVQLIAEVNGIADNNLVEFRSNDPSIASVDANGSVTPLALGTTQIIAFIKGNEAITASCTVKVSDADVAKTNVSINPIPTTLQKGQTVDIFASVTGDAKKAVFSHWHLDSKDAAYVSLGYDKAQSTTLTARAATKSPVTLYAYAQDGTSTYVQFTIDAPQNLQLLATPDSIKYKGNHTSISDTDISMIAVTNAFVGEEFVWNIVPSSQYGVLAASQNFGDFVEVTAGPLEGRITVTATSKADATRTASVTVFVNREAAYGNAKITPAVATWQKGQAALQFTVSPSYYYAWLDGKPLTPQSKSYTYHNGVLTLSTALLSTLSSGEHTLKVQTSSGNGVDGLVYATIYITGSASNVYGDNAHVRGSAYNLYFTSTDPIKEVYISNQWIDPANYTLTNNGTGLTLKSDFLNKLGYGSYSMRLVTQNGYNQNASFRIVTANYAPATGDDANMGAWMALMILSLAGAAVLIPKRKKSTDMIG